MTRINRRAAGDGAMKVRGEVGRKALRSARELAHLATSVAAEAANLTRAMEVFGAAQASVAASHASIRAAQGAFSIDAAVLAPGAAGDAEALQEVFLQTEACLESAEQALAAARLALRAASAGLTHAGAENAATDS